MENMTKESTRINGYQRHLVAPEFTIRSLIRQSIHLGREPICELLERIFGILIESRDVALEKLRDKLVMKGDDDAFYTP